MKRRKAISSLIKSSLGATAVIGSMGSITAGCQSANGKQQKTPAGRPMLMKVESSMEVQVKKTSNSLPDTGYIIWMEGIQG